MSFSNEFSICCAKPKQKATSGYLQVVGKPRPLSLQEAVNWAEDNCYDLDKKFVQFVDYFQDIEKNANELFESIHLNDDDVQVKDILMDKGALNKARSRWTWIDNNSTAVTLKLDEKKRWAYRPVF